LPDFLSGADDSLEGRGKPFILVLRVPERFLLLILFDLVEVDEGEIRALEQGAAIIIFQLVPGRVLIDAEDLHVQGLEQRALLFPLLQQPRHLLGIGRIGIGWIDGPGRGAGMPGSSALLLCPRGSGRGPSLLRGRGRCVIPVGSLAKTHGGTDRPERQKLGRHHPGLPLHGQSTSVLLARALQALLLPDARDLSMIPRTTRGKLPESGVLHQIIPAARSGADTRTGRTLPVSWPGLSVFQAYSHKKQRSRSDPDPSVP